MSSTTRRDAAMIVDSSALVAVLMAEPEAEEMSDLLESRPFALSRPRSRSARSSSAAGAAKRRRLRSTSFWR